MNDSERKLLAHQIREINSENILNGLIETLMFRAERASMDLSKRELIRRGDKIICPREFCTDPNILGTLIYKLSELGIDYSITHDSNKLICFKVSMENGEIQCPSDSLGRSLVRATIIKKLCYD
jgi:hypothetical protein